MDNEVLLRAKNHFPKVSNDKNQEANEALMIPKHRFDCVNLCLKETKQALKDARLEADEGRIRTANLQRVVIDARVETILALHKAKSLIAAKSLIDFSKLKLEHDGTVPGLEEQVLEIKKSQGYLFEGQEVYVLMPLNP